MENSTIMIVDDEDALRQLLRMELEDEGYSVMEAYDGEDALTTIEANGRGISIVITDMQMPRKNGLMLSREIRACCPYIKIIFISARPLSDVISIFSCPDEIGINNFVQKSHDTADLLNKVAEFATQPQ